MKTKSDMLEDALGAIYNLSSLLVNITKKVEELESEIKELQGYIYSNIEVKGKISSAIGNDTFYKVDSNNPYQE